MRRASSDEQSTIELALCLPALVVVIGFMLEVGFVATDQVRVWHAAREAARVAAVTGDSAAILDAARGPGLDSASVVVTPGGAGRSQGGAVTAAVTMKHPASIPVIGKLLGVVLEGSATMRIESP